MNIVSKKSTLMSFALAGLIAGNMPTTAHALKYKDLTLNKTLLAAFVLGSLLYTNCKEAEKKPETVTGNDVKKLLQIQNIFTQEYWENVAHLINDGYCGQVGVRGKAVLGITNEEDGSMMFKEVDALPTTGICGKTIFMGKILGKKFNDLTKTLAVPVLAYMWFVDGTEMNFKPASDGIKVEPKAPSEKHDKKPKK